MDAVSFERVYDSFQEFHAFVAASFGHKQWRERSRNYLQALLVQGQEWRNAEDLSESVGVSARAMQRFLSEARWDDDAVIGWLQEYLGLRLGYPEAVWVFDGSDFPKQGRKSAGVARQYCGRPGSWPTARPGCSWPTSAHWAARWWTSGCICRRDGPPTSLRPARVLPFHRGRPRHTPPAGARALQPLLLIPSCKSSKQSPSPLIQQSVPHSPDHHRLLTVPGAPHHLKLSEPLRHEPQTSPHDRARHRQTPIRSVVHTPLMPSAHWTKF